ncbi:hypothetical protein [Lactococcus lactis]|uniref:hypothetical protein n=1 Tax=Lactococcus lactis TaxID=1358 RepID=UPI00288DBFB9|nr:hypothetical protein [Lactococcus lactis]MDT2877239.1 hypothetical protein [Lactococcus lactis]
MITKTEYRILSVFDDGRPHDVSQISEATKIPFYEVHDLTKILRNQDMITINLSGGFMRSEKGTLAKFEYKEGNKNNLFDKLIYPITQNIASHILVLLTGFIIGLISSGKLYKLIQLLFHL